MKKKIFFFSNLGWKVHFKTDNKTHDNPPCPLSCREKWQVRIRLYQVYTPWVCYDSYISVSSLSPGYVVPVNYDTPYGTLLLRDIKWSFVTAKILLLSLGHAYLFKVHVYLPCVHICILDSISIQPITGKIDECQTRLWVNYKLMPLFVTTIVDMSVLK